MTVLRDAGPDDSLLVADLHVRSWQDAYRGILPDAYLNGPLMAEKRAHWRRILSAPPAGAVILIANEGTRPVGFVAAYPRPQCEALIDNLHVLPGQRGGGTGRRLMQGTAARLLEAGIRSARLTVYEANTAAVAFYRRIGGRCTGRGIARNGGYEAPDLEFVFDLERLGAPA